MTSFDSDTEQHESCVRFLKEGKYREALSSADTIYTPALRAMILIDGGFGAGLSGKIREGIEIFEDMLSVNQPKLQFTRSSIFYNAANGRSALYTLRRKKGAHTFPTEDNDLRMAKQHYRDALVELDPQTGSFASQLWVNYGNCLSQCGRFAEAIECYEKALKADLSNGMAAGNLAIELEHAAGLTLRYRHEYAALAYDLLTRALCTTMHLKFGSVGAIRDFQARLANLQAFIDAHQEPILPPSPVEVSTENRLLSEYIRFCVERGLFLNLWVGDTRLLPAITDDISFDSIVTPIDDDYLVPELCRILNEIKESYTTARYIYFLSQRSNSDLDHVSAMTIYHDFGNYEVTGLYAGLCKTAYSRAFDVLDKVARIVNVYFDIGNPRRSFWETFATKQSLGKAQTIRYGARPEICETHNVGLYALADVCVDYFESEHVDWRTVDARRNQITHDYLDVRLYTSEERNDDRIVKWDNFRVQTRNVLLLAKYAIIYAVSAINLAENQRDQDAGQVVTMPVFTTPGQPFL